MTSSKIPKGKIAQCVNENFTESEYFKKIAQENIFFVSLHSDW